MTKQRPYINNPIDELERLVEASRADPAALKRVAAELKHRATDRAHRLRGKVTAILDGYELPLVGSAGPPVPASRSSAPLLPGLPGLTYPPRHNVPPTSAPAAETGPGAVSWQTYSPRPVAPASMAVAPPPVAKPEPAPAILAQHPKTAPAAATSKIQPSRVDPTPAHPPERRKPMPTPEPKSVTPANPVVLERMTDLIDYVIAVEKNKQKIVTDYVAHGGFHRRHDELEGMPGVALNRLVGDDATYLTVERLTRRPPPDTADATLKPWLALTDDPGKEPGLRSRLSATECRAADIVMDQTQSGIELTDFAGADAVRTALAAYLAGPWTAWVLVEAPRRRAIALYTALFALRQTLASPDGAPQELVCGIGYAALLRGGKRLHYPLLTVPLDIELDPVSHIIALVPRAEARSMVEADAPDAFDLNGVNAWRLAAKAQIEGLDDDPLSPFAPSTFEGILQNAAAFFDPGATYSTGTLGLPLPIATPGPQLRITDGFGFLQRERRATQLMADLQAFRDRLAKDDGATEIPPAVAALFTNPSGDVAGEEFPTFRGINSIAGMTSSDGSGADLFFPKPFNAEQVQIAQRLAVRDGVVVQGPPGTGKTHTIANIISHYLATGRRVLVTSQKTPALKVLQEQLPTPIRPLAVSLLDSDREGLQQFRGSVDLIANKLQGLRRAELEAEINGLDATIDKLHRRLALIDRQIDKIGRTALTSLTIDGQSIDPLDAAREVLGAGADATWLPDEIGPEQQFDPDFGDEDIGTLRIARQALGDDLAYLGKSLPPADLLADTDRILTDHERLQQAAVIEGQIAAGEVWRLVDTRPETIDDVEAATQALTAWNQLRQDIVRTSGPVNDTLDRLLGRPRDPVLIALRELHDQARALEEDQRFLLTRPVELAAGCREDAKFREKVADLAQGGAGMGALAGLFARVTKAHLEATRVRGRSPADSSDWQAVARYLDANDGAITFISSWNNVVAGTGLPALEKPIPAAGRTALDVLDRLGELEALQAEAARLTTELRRLLPRWSGVIEWQADPRGVFDCLNLHLDLARLQDAKAGRKALAAAIGGGESDVHQKLRALASRVGEPGLLQGTLAEEIARCAKRLRQLHDMQPHRETIERITVQIAARGAPRWAAQLRAAPAGASDAWCPANWRSCWRLRRLDGWLEASNQAGRLRALQQEREEAERDLSKAYVRSIEQRTWRALKHKASPQVLTALSAYAVAVGRIGRGTGKSANRHRKAARDAANAVKGALPCWIMPHHRVSESLPAEFGIFDLVIVDEASQSTLSSLPALFRARQILVVGDDKQVSPDNVGLDMAQANTLVARHLAKQVPMFVEPMRQESSLYDLASVIFGADRFMLREHFRCAGPIIEFSKRQFYSNELSPLRISKASERLDPVLIDVLVKNGYRKGKTNPPEADFILEELQRLGDDSAYDGRSIGVTTLLGTEQAALIDRRIRNELGIPFMEKYRIRVGDPVVFQGDERDIMFLSMVASRGEATALTGLAYEQRFNVAASRARERMILVRSIELDQLSPADKLRRALLEHFRSPFPNDPEQAAETRLRCESDFEREMFDDLTRRGYALDTQVRAGQFRIDIVVEGDDDRRLAVECDGDRYHGPDRWEADMQRQRTLERAGWRFWRCFASRFVRERQAVLDELCALLDAMDIKPRSVDTRSANYTQYREWPSEDPDGAVADTTQAEAHEDGVSHGTVPA